MSDEEKIQIAALGLLGLFNRKPKSKPETKEDPGVLTQPDSSDSEDSDGDKLRDGPGRRETKEQEETPQQKLDKINSNPDNEMILIAIDTLFDEIYRKNDEYGIILRDLIVAIRDNKRVQRIFGIDSIREGGNSNPVKNLFDKIDSYPTDKKLSKDELILFFFDDEQSVMFNMLKATMHTIITALTLYDANRDGYISETESTRVFEQQGRSIEDAKEYLRLTDVDRDGQVSPAEFTRSVIHGKGPLAPWYVDMINTSFERAQSGQLLLKDMARPDKKKKRKRKKTRGLSNAEAKQAALELFTDEGLRTEDGDFVEYIVNRDTAEKWEEVINKIALINNQARFALFQAIVKGMYKIKTYEDDNISLKNLRNILKPDGQKYLKGMIKVTRNSEVIDQTNLNFVKAVIKDLKNGDDFFKKYKPPVNGKKSKNPKGVNKPKKKTKRKVKTSDGSEAGARDKADFFQGISDNTQVPLSPPRVENKSIGTLRGENANVEHLSVAFPKRDITLKKMAIDNFDSLQPRLRF